VKRDSLTFVSAGVDLDGWHFTGEGAAYEGASGRPAVVMAHGLGGTKDSGLEPFASALAEAGLDVLAFDYRGFGASGGTPRQRASMTGQVEDYRAGKDKAFNSLVGQVMKATQGKANPAQVSEILKRRLAPAG